MGGNAPQSPNARAYCRFSFSAKPAPDAPAADAPAPADAPASPDPAPEADPSPGRASYIPRLARRAKYLVASLDREDTLIMHLGMSGRFEIAKSLGVIDPKECIQGIG